MATAFAPFKEYIEYLAEGKLDGYLDSNCRMDKVSVPGMMLSKDPNLLLHELGKNTDMGKTEKLFVHDTVYVIHPCLHDNSSIYLFQSSVQYLGFGQNPPFTRRSLP
jgi:hypothetical protein